MLPTADDDDISLTSSQSEQYSSDAEFEVERILAEKVEHGKRQYLILWENYPVEKSTWEPKNHINSAIIDAWKDRKKQEQDGIEKPFELDKFEDKLKKLAREKSLRKLRRKAKRKRLNIPVSASGSEQDELEDSVSSSSVEAEEENEFEDVPATRTNSKRKKSSSPGKKISKPFRATDDASAKAAPGSSTTRGIARPQKELGMNGKSSSSRVMATNKSPQVCLIF